MKELIAKLVKLGARECWSDDDRWAGANEYAGGNIDDAYTGGREDGEATLAREVLKVLCPDGLPSEVQEDGA